MIVTIYFQIKLSNEYGGLKLKLFHPSDCHRRAKQFLFRTRFNDSKDAQS